MEGWDGGGSGGGGGTGGIEVGFCNPEGVFCVVDGGLGLVHGREALLNAEDGFGDIQVSSGGGCRGIGEVLGSLGGGCGGF